MSLRFPLHDPQHDLDHEEDDLHPADEGEAGEEAHGASDSGQLVHELGCTVLESNTYSTRIILMPLTLVILSKVEVENDIFTNLSLLENFRSKANCSRNSRYLWSPFIVFG